MTSREIKRLLIALLALGITGAIRLPLEEQAAERLREARLIEPRIDQSTREKLGQRAAFFALGGLRSPVATWRSFIAQEHFSNSRWVELEQEYALITTLAPHNEFHWITGGWHLGYNASGFFERQTGMNPLQQEQLVRSYINKGRAFHRDGIRHNPESWELMARLGSLYDDRERYPDYDKAADWFSRASEIDGAPPFYARATAYALARSPGRERETLDYLKQLWQTPIHRVPSVRVLIFVLQNELDLPETQRIKMRELWEGSLPRAYFDLVNYQRKAPEYPRSGLREALIKLEQSLNVPQSESRLLPETGQSGPVDPSPNGT